jgi:hypothetical protein
MINAEMLLNPSWFMEDCLATTSIGSDSTFCAELQACVDNIESLFLDAVYVAQFLVNY